METFISTDDEVLSLSPFDQVAARFYVRWLLCYCTEQSTYPGHAHIVESLEVGIATTVKELPFLRGSVHSRQDDESRVEVRISSSTYKSPLVIKRMDSIEDETVVPYLQLRDTGFPVASLPGDLLSPVPFVPMPPSPTPVLAVQANFIRGGLILCVAIHHSTADGSGMGNIISGLLRNCRQILSCEPVSKTLRDSDSTGLEDPLLVDRSFLAPQSDVKRLEHSEYSLVSPENLSARVPLQPANTPTCLRLLRFSTSIFNLLKRSQGETSGSLTTNDILTGLLFAAVCTARSLRLNRTGLGPKIGMDTSRIIIAVNGRSRMQPPIQPSFIGNVVVSATFCIPFPLAINHDILHASLVLDLANRTHAAVSQIGHNHMVSALGLIESLDNVLSLQTAAGQNGPGKDFGITSWMHLPLYQEELWAGGTCESVRVPAADVDGLAIVLPRAHTTANIEVMLGLREDDLRSVEKILDRWMIGIV
ncbi:MAG: hypothetical protein Q9218_003991 [Villophora microphyllina]